MDLPVKNSGRARFSISCVSSALNHAAATGLIIGTSDGKGGGAGNRMPRLEICAQRKNIKNETVLLTKAIFNYYKRAPVKCWRVC